MCLPGSGEGRGGRGGAARHKNTTTPDMTPPIALPWIKRSSSDDKHLSLPRIKWSYSGDDRRLAGGVWWRGVSRELESFLHSPRSTPRVQEYNVMTAVGWSARNRVGQGGWRGREQKRETPCEYKRPKVVGLRTYLIVKICVCSVRGWTMREKGRVFFLLPLSALSLLSHGKKNFWKIAT